MKITTICWLLAAAMFGATVDAFVNAGQRQIGYQAGYDVANAEHAARNAERTRVLKMVGVCKWAKIMAEDIKCQSELP